MESVNRTKLYMLLELEKIKQNVENVKGVFPFPISLLGFEVLFLKGNKKMIFKLNKKKIEDEWKLYSEEKIESKYFDDQGVFSVRDVEAYKVLKALSETIEFDSQISKGEVENIENLLLEHRKYFKAMEEFNKIKEGEAEDAYETVKLENRHKDKNSRLLENLCDRIFEFSQ